MNIIYGWIFTVIMSPFVAYKVLWETKQNASRTLRKGSCLEPYSHPSYSNDKAILIRMAADLRDAEIISAQKEYDRVVKDLN